MRVLSLCSGYGGIELGLENALNAEIVGFAEIDKGASKVLKHNFPEIPNFGDLHEIDYSDFGEIDLISAGFPCQDVSAAGARAGLRAGTRTGVWYEVYRAIDEIRPKLVLLENVRGLLSAWADSDMESCPWCLGETGTEHALRAAGAVCGDLASLGYDAVWQVVSAADAGAPHRRERVFIFAYADGEPRERPGSVETGSRVVASVAGVAESRSDSDGEHAAFADTGQHPHPQGNSDFDSSSGGGGEADGDPAGSGRRLDGRRDREGPERFVSGERAEEPVEGTDDADAECRRWHGRSYITLTGATLREAAWRLGERLAANAAGTRREGDAGEGSDSVGELPREPWAGGDGDAADSELAGLEGVAVECVGGAGEPAEGGHQNWGAYEPAIRRWEARLGRPAPRPAEPGPTGNMRLSPRFVEWMMGLPEGWVTKVPGLSRTDQLKALGNGVVPQQLELAVDVLLEAVTGIPAGSRRDGHLESRLFPTPQVMDAKRGVRPAEDIESARQGVGVTRGGCSNLRERIMEVVDA